MKKRGLVLVMLVAALLQILVFAHPGRLDSNGGHHDRKNGGYHYHNGYGSSGGGSGGSSYKSSASVKIPVHATRVNAVHVPTQINTGDEVQLEGSIYPSNAEEKDITWKSENPEVASVSSSGALKAVGVGTATIVAKTSNGTESKFTIVIKEVLSENMEISEKPAEMFVGDKICLNVQFLPENTTDKTVVWTSENERAATISSSGELVAVGVGETTITVTHGELTDEFSLRVNPVEAKEIRIEWDNAKDVYKNDEVQLSCIILPENTTDKAVVWRVSNPEIADIDENGMLTAKEKGVVQVMVTASNGITDEIEIEVSSNAPIVVISLIIIGILGGVLFFLIKLLKRLLKKA